MPISTDLAPLDRELQLALKRLSDQQIVLSNLEEVKSKATPGSALYTIASKKVKAQTLLVNDTQAVIADLKALLPPSPQIDAFKDAPKASTKKP